MNQEEKEVELDLREILHLLIHNVVAIIAVTVVGAIIAGIISIYCITPLYTATSKIFILTQQDSVVSLSDLQIGSNLANDYEELIKSRPVVEKVAENLKLDMTYSELLGYLTVTNPENTRIVGITITYRDADIAKDMANEFAEVSRNQIAEIMVMDKPTVVEEAVVPKNPSSPNNTRNIIIGAVLGFILAAAVVIIRHMIDDTLKTPEDVERYIGITVLAAIPNEGGTDNTEKSSKSHKRKKGISKAKK